MAFIVVLILPLLVLAVFTVAACAILEVAFAGPQVGRESFGRAQRWQPPLVRGDELLAWASDTAKAATASRLAGPRSRETAKQVATEIYIGMACAISHSPSAVGPPKRGCPSCRHQRIGVTPPEALAIADAVHTNRAWREAKRIRDRATRNTEAISGLGHEQYEQARVVCPLLLSDGCCAAFDARPVHCRGWCLLHGGDVEPDVLSLTRNGAGPVDAHAHTVARGAEVGLSRGLASAGLDGTVYELNSALVVAMDTPSAAENWASGSSVFELCQRYE